MSARLLFILLLCVIGALCHIIGYWRRKAGEAAFAVARMADKEEERDRDCRLAVNGKRVGCTVSHVPTCSRIIRHSSRSSRTASEWHFTDIIIRHGTIYCSRRNSGRSAVRSTSSRRAKSTVSSSSRRAWMLCKQTDGLIIS